MSTKYLGDTFDIHGGGRDLIFPHHENEIAQSEAATGKPFVRFFVHNGFVTHEGVKMAKSLGNIITIQEVVDQTDQETVRLLLLAHHYRSPVDFSHKALMEASENMDDFYLLLKAIDTRLATTPSPNESPKTLLEKVPPAQKKDLDPLLSFGERFEQAMDDDFNTALAIGHFHDMARVVNRILHQPGFDPALDNPLLVLGRDFFRSKGAVLGLFQSEPKLYLHNKNQKKLERVSLDEAEINRLVRERENARRSKDWKRADQIRDDLAAQNILLEDGPDGTRWRIRE
jgi:cysteinyl-tRNA synthetase